jgi:hypothetical protein
MAQITLESEQGLMKFKKIPDCKLCGQQFDNIFEATDHLLDDVGEEEFDPKLILPNGYILMVGSLLRCIYKYAESPEEIKSITQSTYATLYAAEKNPGQMKHFIEDMVVHEHMINFEDDLLQLLAEETNDNEEDGE